MHYRLTALLASTLALACGPIGPDDKAPPQFTTTDETTSGTDPTLTGADSFGTTTSVMTSTTMPSPEPLTTSGTSTTSTTSTSTGGDAESCKLALCGGEPCEDPVCETCDLMPCNENAPCSDGFACVPTPGAPSLCMTDDGPACANDCAPLHCGNGCPLGTQCAATDLCVVDGTPVCTLLPDDATTGEGATTGRG